MSVQTFCTSLKRPERAAHAAAWARGRRLAVARAGTRRQPVGWRGKRIGPQRRQSPLQRWEQRLGQRPTGAAWATRPRYRAGPRGESRPSSAGAAARSVTGRPSKLKGASRRKRRPDGPPLTSEPLRPSGRLVTGQAGGLPSSGRALPPRHRLGEGHGRQPHLDTKESRGQLPIAYLQINVHEGAAMAAEEAVRDKKSALMDR